jgi:hypothetical protein
MMYDPLALDRQRIDQDAIRRRVATAPQQDRGPKPPREARRRHHGLRRTAAAATSA